LSGRLPSQPFCHRGRKVRGESSLHKNRLFVGAALAATLLRHRAIFTAILAPSGSGRKPFLQKPSFRRSGFRDPRHREPSGFLHRDHRRRKVRGESPSYKNRLFVGAALAATLASSRTGGSGLSKQSSRRDPCAIQGRGLGDGMEGNGGQLPCLNLWCNEGREVASAPLRSLDMSLETPHQVSRASDSHSPGGAGRGAPKGFKAAGPAGAPGSSRGAGGPAAWGAQRGYPSSP
jgi:hypothetical protein